MINFNEDLYWEKKREEMERDEAITSCDCCGEEIRMSEASEDGYYRIDGADIHKECLEEWFTDYLTYYRG